MAGYVKSGRTKNAERTQLTYRLKRINETYPPPPHRSHTIQKSPTPHASTPYTLIPKNRRSDFQPLHAMFYTERKTPGQDALVTSAPLQREPAPGSIRTALTNRPAPRRFRLGVQSVISRLVVRNTCVASLVGDRRGKPVNQGKPSGWAAASR